MHSVFLSARYPPDILGGGEVSTQLIAEGLVAAGNSVTILCGAAVDADDSVNGVRVLRSRALLPWWGKPLREEPVALETAGVIGELTATFSSPPDIIHAHEFRSALALSLIDHPRRMVTIRDFAPICGTTSNLWWDGTPCNGCFWPNVLFRCHRVVEASLPRKPFRVAQYKGNLGFRLRAYRRIPRHVYTSEALKRRVEERLKPPATVRAAVIPNPADPAWLAEDLRPLPEDPVLCAVGRLETTKGTDVLLEAVARARAEIPALHLHLVGGGESARYERLAHALDIRAAVTFHGQVPPEVVREIVDCSRVVVSPHRWEEPFGRVALEAGARARPLITSDLGGVRETTTPATALLVPPGNAEALNSALVSLLRDHGRAAAMGAAARQHVAQSFRAERIAQLHLAAYA